MKTVKIQVASYKKAQVFRKDYARLNGEFLKFQKCSGNHSYTTAELKAGDEFDARGSVYREGVTKWNAADCQSWAKFRFDGERLTAHKFDGAEIPLPRWFQVLNEDEVLSGNECQEVTA